MAVLVEGLSVIIHAERVLAAFGNFDAFKKTVPNQTLCADGELARVGFMNPDDVQAYIDILRQHGLKHLERGRARDMVVMDQVRGPTSACDWVLFGHIDWQRDPAMRVAACMLAGSKLKELVTPDGWTYERSLTRSFTYVPGEPAETMTLRHSEHGLETWTTPLSAEPLYAGRTTKAFPKDLLGGTPRQKLPWLSRFWGRG